MWSLPLQSILWSITGEKPCDRHTQKLWEKKLTPEWAPKCHRWGHGTAKTDWTNQSLSWKSEHATELVGRGRQRWVLGVHGMGIVVFWEQRRFFSVFSGITPHYTQRSECPFSPRPNVARLCQLQLQPWAPLSHGEKDRPNPSFSVRLNSSFNKVGDTGNLVWTEGNFRSSWHGSECFLFCRLREFPV